MLCPLEVLDYLRIRGLALIDDLQLELGQGMNVLTGETGAGKSIIVGSLALLRGGPGRSGLVRDGFDLARVEAQFNVGGSSVAGADPGESSRDGGYLRAALDASDIVLDEGALVVGRSIGINGRSRSHLQDKLTTRNVLERVGEHLIDICSQHEHHSLTRVSRHIELLDDFGGLETKLGEYRELYRQWRGAVDHLQSLREMAATGLDRADYLRFQLEEFDGVDLDASTFEDTRERLVFLRDARDWQGFADETRLELYESDRSICGRLSAWLDRARAGRSPALREIAEQLEIAQIACEEAASAAGRLARDLDVDGGELQAAEDRVHELERLRRKHGCSVSELAARRESMQAELEALDDFDARLAAAEADESTKRAACVGVAEQLRKARKSAARRLSSAIEAELSGLHIREARFRVELNELDPEQLGPRGLDAAEFMFSANPGEALAPLHKVASGGELSRVLLAIKSVLSTGDRVVTYVFDEVDSGVGGAVAESIGRRLKATSRDRQVLCITHLPQIAAFADAHYRVQKTTRGGRTVTAIVKLSDAQRVEELARMLGGARITASAREHAAALIREAAARQAEDGGQVVGKGSAETKASTSRRKSGAKNRVTRAKATSSSGTSRDGVDSSASRSTVKAKKKKRSTRERSSRAQA